MTPYGYSGKKAPTAKTWALRWLALMAFFTVSLFWLTLPAPQAPLPTPQRAAITWAAPPAPPPLVTVEVPTLPTPPAVPQTVQPGRDRQRAAPPVATPAPPSRPAPRQADPEPPPPVVVMPQTPTPAPAAPAPPQASPTPPAQTPPAQTPSAQTPPQTQPPPARPAPDVAARTPSTSAPQPPAARAPSRAAPPAGTGPMIAIVIGDLGLSDTATAEAIQKLPGEITLSFLPERAVVNDLIFQAHDDGHETILQFPQTIPFWSAQDDEEALFVWSGILQSMPTVTGVTNFAYGRPMFLPGPAIEALLEPVLLNNLYYIDSSAPTTGAVAGEPQPAPGSVLFIDRQAEAAAIDAQLKQLEALARNRGYAIGIGLPYPVTMERLPIWARDLRAQGFQLVSLGEMRKRLGWP